MHSKGNHKESEKTTYRQGENICKWSNQQGINHQNIQIGHAAQYQEKQVILIWAHKFNHYQGNEIKH